MTNTPDDYVPQAPPAGLRRIAYLFRGVKAPVEYEAFVKFTRSLVARSNLSSSNLSEAQEEISRLLSAHDDEALTVLWNDYHIAYFVVGPKAGRSRFEALLRALS